MLIHPGRSITIQIHMKHGPTGGSTFEKGDMLKFLPLEKKLRETQVPSVGCQLPARRRTGGQE